MDGLLIHPLMGATKDGDIAPEVRMKCYETLIGKYYHPEHTMLAVMPAAMRYAGPKECVLHAILRAELWMFALHRGARSCRSREILRNVCGPGDDGFASGRCVEDYAYEV